MNKISIVSLLNPQPSDSDNTGKIKFFNQDEESLLKMRNDLLKLQKKLSYADIKNDDADNILNKVLHGLKSLRTNKKYSKSDCGIIQNISQLSAIIVKLVNGKKNLVHFCKEISEDKNPDDGSGIIFNVVTQDMMESGRNDINSLKGHRLPKQHVQILKNWYKKHSENPYLNDNHIRNLMKETGFTRSQIKNWVANKRRKNKNTTISPEISDLLA